MSGSEMSTGEISATPPSKPKPKPRQWVLHALLVLVSIGIGVSMLLFHKKIENFPVVGYPAVLLIRLAGNATLVLPTPSLAVVFGVGGQLNPVAVGLIAGLGSALGELTGYLAGVGGRVVVENQETYARVERWMRKRGTLVIFGLALVPNPVFDVGGMVAGASNMPVWQFLLAAWAGKSLRLVLFALGGQYFIVQYLSKL